jgi:hypothetical protein
MPKLYGRETFDFRHRLKRVDVFPVKLPVEFQASGAHLRIVVVSFNCSGKGVLNSVTVDRNFFVDLKDLVRVDEVDLELLWHSLDIRD